MHFFRDCGVTGFLLLQNRHTVHLVHNLRAGAPARSILMYFMYTQVLRAVLRGTQKKSLFLEAPLGTKAAIF
ncbi:MAG: hypothetical protein ACI8XX_000049 [Polaribacter sp.]|jgi:hypothetical protein